jgi:hypothetical protein
MISVYFDIKIIWQGYFCLTKFPEMFMQDSQCVELVLEWSSSKSLK